MKTLFRNNGLSIVFFIFFLITIAGQGFTGLRQYNQEMKERVARQVTLRQYLRTGHFIEATFENWESEFLQMGLFVFLSMCLYQKGSSESKDPDKKEEVDKVPNKRKKNVPWPVKKGGIFLTVYENSLSLALFLFFLFSFIMHWYGSLKEYNETQVLNHQPVETAVGYLGNSKLWFESFENWQSEFLSVFAIVILSIFLRQKGSAQSKPVDAADSETGS
jgi:hypothetical protein